MSKYFIAYQPASRQVLLIRTSPSR